MPELPDIEILCAALRDRVSGAVLRSAKIKSPFVLRTFEPPIEDIEGRCVLGVERIGKRIVLALDGDLFLVLHLMIAGRLLWKPGDVVAKGKLDLAAFVFEVDAARGLEGPAPAAALLRRLCYSEITASYATTNSLKSWSSTTPSALRSAGHSAGIAASSQSMMSYAAANTSKSRSS